MQAEGIKRRGTEGGNDNVNGEGTDEIIEQDGGIYSVASQHKPVRQPTLQHCHAQADSLWWHQGIELRRQMLT